MIVPKPTDPEKLKKREEILRSSREFPTEELKEALEWIQAKMEQEERERKEQEEIERKEQEERERKEKSTEEELFDALKWISDGDLLNSMAKIEAARLQAKAEAARAQAEAEAARLQAKAEAARTQAIAEATRLQAEAEQKNKGGSKKK